jgi:hypothetical protein
MTYALTKQNKAPVSALELVQRAFPNYHPIVALAKMAHRADVQDDPRLEFEVHKAILPYVTPKLASVEVSVKNPDDRRVVVSLFETHVLENGSTVDVEVPLVSEVEDVVPLDQ